MNYYSLDFQYKGPYANNPDCSPEADRALQAAMSEMYRVLNELKLEHVHQYSWTDGSLYEYVRTEMEEAEFSMQMQKVFEGCHFIMSVAVCKVDASCDPWKVGRKTLKEYFDGSTQL